MRHRPLGELLRKYRFEAKLSANVAHNSSARDGQVAKLQQTQEWLWEKYAWPHLRVRRTIDLQAGERYYDPKGAKDAQGVMRDDLSLDRIERIEVFYGQEWCCLDVGIGDEQYAAYNSDLDVRSWPVERWQIYEDEMIEVWPVPAADFDSATLEGRLRLTGIRSLGPLIEDDDTADLDDKLIVLFAAADKLASDGDKAAQLVLDKARDVERRLTGNLEKLPKIRLFGDAGPKPPRTAQMPRVHYRET